MERTDWLIEMMRKIPVALLVKILEQLFAELELFLYTLVNGSLGLPHLLRRVSVRQVLWRRGMNLPLWTAGLFIATNDGHRR